MCLLAQPALEISAYPLEVQHERRLPGAGAADHNVILALFLAQHGVAVLGAAPNITGDAGPAVALPAVGINDKAVGTQNVDNGLVGRNLEHLAGTVDRDLKGRILARLVLGGLGLG